MAHSPGWFATTVRDRRQRRADFRTAAAAILGEEDQQLAHGVEIDGIDDRAALTTRLDEPRIRKDEKWRRHGVRRGAEPPSASTRRQPCTSRLREQRTHPDPRIRRQSGKAR